MSDRSQPPEKCFRGNVPLRVQRNSVVRWTPTTRRTSAVVIRWSRRVIHSEAGSELGVKGCRCPGDASEKLSDSCRGPWIGGPSNVSLALDLAVTHWTRME